MQTRKHVLRRSPEGMPTEDDFDLVESTVPDPADREVLIAVRYVSLDPGQRSRLGTGSDYAGSLNVAVDGVMTGYAVGEVVESNHPAFAPGDSVQGELEWAEYCVVSGDDLTPVDVPAGVSESAALSVLGGTGRTAYFGLFDVGEPRPGETVVVSAAAGAVGSVVGQLARLAGCRTVGITGSDEKVDYLTTELDFDAAVNYRTADVAAPLGDACPDGVDVYFDNVGGEIYDAVLGHLNQRARIAVCGKISLYNDDEPAPGPRFMHQRKRVREEGFMVHDFAHRFDEADRRLGEWLSAGDITVREDVSEGVEQLPSAFIGLFEGDNIGKQLVAIPHETDGQ